MPTSYNGGRTKMGYKTATIGLLLAAVLSAQPAAEKPSVDPEIERLQTLVEAGVIPPAQLEAARREARRRELESTVRGLLQAPDLGMDEMTTLLGSVAELRNLERAALARQTELVEAGVVPPNSLRAYRDRVELVDRQFELAGTRSRLIRERMQIASAEDRLDELIDQELALWSPGDEWDSDIVEIDAVYFSEFDQALPISAAGSTDLHISMGFDHTGRYDVALHPDEYEGLFLMSLLDEWNIPYIAFRSAVPGQATGPHIHIGPPSLRLDPEEIDRQVERLLEEAELAVEPEN